MNKKAKFSQPFLEGIVLFSLEYLYVNVLDYLSLSNVARVRLRRTVMLCFLMLLSPVADSLPCCSFSLLFQESTVVFLSPQKPTIANGNSPDVYKHTKPRYF